MILERLRTETKEAHQALEKLIIPHIKQATRESYIQLLCIFYGYYKAIEDLVDMYLDDSAIPMYNQRRKAATILNDINDMGGDMALAEFCNNPPVINNAFTALGAIYVLEGSTLGGKIISKMLMQNLALNDTTGVQFFCGYGTDTDSMWQSFTTALNGYKADSREQDEIVSAATATFNHFREWIIACQ